MSLVDGVPLHVYVTGEPLLGDVLLIPGLCVSAYLRPAADAMAREGFRVHLVDPPGWPYSGRPAVEPASAGELGRALARWVESAGLTSVAVVGQSFGAQLAPHVAAAVPNRVRLVVLHGPTFDPAYRTYARALVRWLADLPRERISLLMVETPEWLRVGLARVRRMLALSLDDRLEHTVRQVTRPVAVVVGEHDTLSTPAWAAALASSPDRFVVMAGLPHSSPYSDPAGFARIVRQLHEQTVQ